MKTFHPGVSQPLLLSLEGLVVSPLCELDPTTILPTVGVLKGRTVVLWRAADPVEAA